MSNLFSQSSSNFIPFTKPDLLHNELPVGTYNINYNEKIGFYLSETEAFTLPSKIYGGNTEYSDIILDTFLNDRKNKITSAVLSGIKGSGKTLTAKQISIKDRSS